MKGNKIMKNEKIKDVAEALFTFIRYTLGIIFSIIAGVTVLFTLPLIVAMIGGYPHAFTGFCISTGSLIISTIMLGLLDLEEWEETPVFF